VHQKGSGRARHRQSAMAMAWCVCSRDAKGQGNGAPKGSAGMGTIMAPGKPPSPGFLRPGQASKDPAGAAAAAAIGKKVWDIRGWYGEITESRAGAQH
jgi:hypothetical protein